MPSCKICNEPFELTIPHNRVTCSDKCSDINNKILKKESYLRNKKERIKKRDRLREKYNLPYRIIEQYGEEFLDENPIVLETLQTMNKINGKFTFLTEEEIDIRRKSRTRESNKKAREKIGPVEKECKICKSKFNTIGGGSNNRVTCSDECRRENTLINRRKAGKKYREKQKLKKLNN